RTAATLAEVLESLGYAVCWLGASSAVKPRGITRYREYERFDQLDEALQSLLAEQRFDAVIHAAAVSDFSLSGGAEPGKLASGGCLTLALQPNPKLIGRIKSYSRHGEPCLVGFKLTAGADPASVSAAVRRQFDQSPVDYVVHNDFAQIQAGEHRFTVFGRDPDGDLRTLGDYEHARDLAVGLSSLLKEAVVGREASA
ncbi:MAG: phosphopantothenoylcysteine decarboxylase, partial [Anaerolineae bacterium]